MPKKTNATLPDHSLTCIHADCLVAGIWHHTSQVLLQYKDCAPSILGLQSGIKDFLGGLDKKDNVL